MTSHFDLFLGEVDTTLLQTVSRDSLESSSVEDDYRGISTGCPTWKRWRRGGRRAWPRILAEIRPTTS